MSEEIKKEQSEQTADSSKNYPEVVVAAIIYNDNDEILLTQSKKWKNLWQIPGGHIEMGETREQALKREIMEETGLEIDNIQPLYVEDCVYPKDFERKVHFVFLDYSAHTAGGKMAEKNYEMENYKWMKPEQALKEVKMNPYTENLVKIYIENKNNNFEGLYKRALADYQNLLKQTAKEKMEFAMFANAELLKKIMPIFFDLSSALKDLKDDKDPYTQGIRLLAKKIMDVFNDIGIIQIKTEGERFDHNTMQALQSVPTDDKEKDGIVVQEYTPGFKFNGKLLVYASVSVYKLK